MAWRPTQYLIEGELDNTTPGRVTGWLRFAGLAERVTLDLAGNFHRDIRGARIRITGEADPANPEAAGGMEGFALQQTGEAGDITAGLPPHDYSTSPYVEWYGNENGRVVLEPRPDQVQVIGRPIPPIESDPISRAEQDRKMGRFMQQISEAVGVPVVLARTGGSPPDDPAYSHWVVGDGAIVGEARDVEDGGGDKVIAFVRLFGGEGERGTITRAHLAPKRRD